MFIWSKIYCCYNEKRCTLNDNLRCFSIIGWETVFFVLTLTMTLSVSSLGKKTQTQRRSCMVLLLWKFSLFIFEWLAQDRPFRLLPGLWALWRPASTTAGTDTTRTSPCNPASAAAQSRQTSTYGLSRPNSTHKAEHGGTSCSLHCGDKREEKGLDVRTATSVLSLRNGYVVDIKMIKKKNTNLQINSLTPKESERIREITDT